MKCRKTAAWERDDVERYHRKERLIAWLTGVQSKTDVAKRYGVSRRALSKEFKRFFRQSPNCKIPEKFKAKMLIVDGKFIHGRVCCALIALTEEDRIFWQFAPDERYGTWYMFLVHFAPPEVVVADGQKGMAYFVKRWWPETAFQRCHFHLVQNVIHYLSRNPKEEAGQFAHRKLRSVRFILRQAIPDLFTYLDFPGCPNTTNDVEGWINREIAEMIGRHRGLLLPQKKTLVSVVLSHLTRPSREKPTRKFP